MGLDTKYRPTTYNEVLGQKATISILRELVKQKRGFRQSYCFSGPFGNGKTTLARVFAKALMCENPDEGNPCNSCKSCLCIEENQNTHPDIIEVDAASNSKKEDIERILEEIRHFSFTGNRRIYILDEAHSISSAGMDSMLLPLENTLPNSEDKRLVCIFCTTEPGKMRPALLSRCAPSFTIELVSPEEIVDRLEFICKEENIEYETEALFLIAENSELHIRDSIKSLESLSSLGKVTKDQVCKYLHLDFNDHLLDVLLSLTDEDFSSIPDQVDNLVKEISVNQIYKKLSEYSMLAYRFKSGVWIPKFLDQDKLEKIHENKNLLRWVKVFSSRPYNVDQYSLICDLHLCHDIYHGVNMMSPINVLGHKKKNDGNLKSEVSKMGVYINSSAQKTSSKMKGSKQNQEKLSDNEFSKSLSEALSSLD